MVSHRKLYRIGVGVAFFTSCFFVYFLYNDFLFTELGNLTFGRSVGGRAVTPEVYFRQYTSSELPIGDEFRSGDKEQVKALFHWQLDRNVPDGEKARMVVSPLKDEDDATYYNDNNNNIQKRFPGRVTLTKLASSKPAPRDDVKVASNRTLGLGRNINKTRSKGRQKYLVYLCESKLWCGGWGDRQRGITTTYLLSKLLGRTFKIIMTTPCNLTKFYRPRTGGVDWLWKGDEIKPSSPRRPVLNDISRHSRLKDELLTEDFNKRYPNDAVFLKTNHDFIKTAVKNPLYASIIKADRALDSRKSRFQSAWKDLMQPNDEILQQLQKVVGAKRLIQKGVISKPFRTIPNIQHSNSSSKSNVSSSSFSSSSSSSLSSSSSSSSKPLICAHVRMGRNPNIPMDERFDSFEPKDIPKLLSFLKSADVHDNADFFLATDYEGIRMEFRRFFGERLIDNKGKIIHIDRQRNDAEACQGFGVAVLDQLILSVCDVLVVSRSGFSIHAAYVSNSSQPAYVMEGGVIKVFKE